MAAIKGRIAVDTERCKGCSVCVAACPFKVLAMARDVNGKGYHFSFMADPERCTGCASCAFVCPDSCITVFRQIKNQDAI